jgi:hypothetical protein
LLLVIANLQADYFLAAWHSVQAVAAGFSMPISV